jgi:UDP-4-amino-4-deoxy-L-arabinose-oxoglutarate aminotransferase
MLLGKPMIKHSKPWITDADRAAVDHQLREGMVASLEKAKEFEHALANRIGASGSISTSSGTAALILCLKALGVGAGKDDEVILPTYVCPTVMRAVIAAGAKPALCDSGPFWNATEQTIAHRFSPRTKAIIAVNIFGISAQLAGLRKYPYLLIEDHCQSFGLQEPIFGAAAFYSFYATKCLTTGEGGAAAFLNGDLVSRASKFRAEYAVPGGLSDLQAALGLSQLSRYDQMLLRRRQIAETYFNELPNHLTHKLSKVAPHSVFYRYPLHFNGDYDTISDRFAERGVAVGRAVSILLHRLVGQSDDDFPNAVASFNSTVSIPIYPAMTDEDVDKVIGAVNAIT